MNISPDKPLSPALAFGSGFLLCWFTMVDMVDGARARRVGCGSPLGRLIDECGDVIVMSCYSVLVAYCLNFDNIILEGCFLYLAIGFYGVELKTVVYPGQVDMIVADGLISPVEIELVLTSVMCSTVFFGTEWL